MSKIVQTEFLTFEEREPKEKTKVFSIATKAGTIIGWIQWYGGFRKYSFFPEANTVWDENCLKDVQSFIGKLMHQRKADAQVAAQSKNIHK